MLANIRVLDFTRLLPGPLASQMLADLGAEVIKIEEPGLGDYARNNIPACVDGLSINFHALNRGKKSVTLNIKDSKDCQTLHKLIATSDVLIESFRPGVLTKYLLKHENNTNTNTNIDKTPYMDQLKQLLNKHPKLIICCISGYGQTGPCAGRAGHDINYISKAGLLSLMKEPKLPPTQIADIAGGSWPAVCQILACLYHRKQSGKGNIIDVSMTDVSYAMGIMPQSVANLVISRNNAKNVQNNNKINDLRKDDSSDVIVSKGNYILVGQAPCYEVYKCKDGYISCGALEPKFWKMFCSNVIERKDLISKQFETGVKGMQIKNEIESILLTKTMSEWDQILANVDCCVETVPLSENVIENNEHLTSRDLNIKLEISGNGRNKGKTDVVNVPKSPFNMLDGLDFQTKPAPLLGEHNEEILSKL